MDIDRDAPATAEGEIRIAAPPETVWEVIADLPGWPAWNPDVRSMSLDGPLEPGSTFRWKSGSASLVSMSIGRSPRISDGLAPVIASSCTTVRSGCGM